MSKSLSFVAAMAAALSFAAIPTADAHPGGGHGGMGGFSHGGGGFGHGGHGFGGGFGHRGFRGGGGFYGFGYGYGPYTDDYYDDDSDYSSCYWRHGRRFCRY